MGETTRIEWADSTWNPATGCTEISPGCDRCYASTLANRFKGTPGHYYETGFAVTLRPNKLHLPLQPSWSKPRLVFVCSMSDLFHQDIPDDYVAQVFAVMSLAHQHTYQVLTKRHGRMRALLGSDAFIALVASKREEIRPGSKGFSWPLRNVWLGVSAEDQRRADLRIPALLEAPAAVRFVSAEPLVGPVDLTPFLAGRVTDPKGDTPDGAVIHDRERQVEERVRRRQPIDWVIIGGETGHGARPMALQWAQGIVDRCTDSGTPVFVKQLGADWGKDHQDISTFPRALQVRQYPGTTGETATNLTAEELAALRERAARGAGRFVDPSVSPRIPNAEWASAILGRPFPGIRSVTWPELYLLHLAALADPDPPPPPRARVTTAQRAHRTYLDRTEEEARREDVERTWGALRKALADRHGVNVAVHHNYTSARHLDGYTQGVDHVVVLADLHAGRLHRTAGQALCQSPSKSKDLVYLVHPGEDRVPECRLCWTILQRLTGIAPEKRGLLP